MVYYIWRKSVSLGIDERSRKVTGRSLFSRNANLPGSLCPSSTRHPCSCSDPIVRSKKAALTAANAFALVI